MQQHSAYLGAPSQGIQFSQHVHNLPFRATKFPQISRSSQQRHACNQQCSYHNQQKQRRVAAAASAGAFSHFIAASDAASAAVNITSSSIPGNLPITDEGSFAHAVQLIASLADSSALQLPSEISASGQAAASAASSAARQSSGGWLGPLTDSLQQLLEYLQHGLEQLHVPYTYGWAIILLTIIVKTATLPLTKIQVESSLAVQNLKPTIDAIKARYGKDQEKIRRETSALYEKSGVKPLAGCLPSIATIPVFIGLYNTLTNVAQAGLLDKEGFLWLPSLSGPSSLAARAAGSGTAWLLPLQDGTPPVGWDQASRYLVLPVLLVVAQWISSAIISPPVDPNDENNRTQQLLVALLPLTIGWFALNVPSGLSLYYFANSVITTGQQVWLRKLGGASPIAFDLGPIEVGKARRTGEIASLSAKPLQLESVGPETIGESEAISASSPNSPAAANGVDPQQVSAAASSALPAKSIGVGLQRTDNKCKRTKRKAVKEASDTKPVAA